MALVGDGREHMQTKMSVMINSPDERFKAARTLARLSLSSPDPHDDCRLILDAAGLLDPEVLTGRPATP